MHNVQFFGEGDGEQSQLRLFFFINSGVWITGNFTETIFNAKTSINKNQYLAYWGIYIFWIIKHRYYWINKRDEKNWYLYTGIPYKILYPHLLSSNDKRNIRPLDRLGSTTYPSKISFIFSEILLCNILHESDMTLQSFPTKPPC